MTMVDKYLAIEMFQFNAMLQLSIALLDLFRPMYTWRIIIVIIIEFFKVA